MRQVHAGVVAAGRVCRIVGLDLDYAAVRVQPKVMSGCGL
jgi:hypothetical protein